MDCAGADRDAGGDARAAADRLHERRQPVRRSCRRSHAGVGRSPRARREPGQARSSAVHRKPRRRRQWRRARDPDRPVVVRPAGALAATQQHADRSRCQARCRRAVLRRRRDHARGDRLRRGARAPGVAPGSARVAQDGAAIGPGPPRSPRQRRRAGGAHLRPRGRRRSADAWPPTAPGAGHRLRWRRRRAVLDEARARWRRPPRRSERGPVAAGRGVAGRRDAGHPPRHDRRQRRGDGDPRHGHRPWRVRRVPGREPPAATAGGLSGTASAPPSSRCSS